MPSPPPRAPTRGRCTAISARATSWSRRISRRSPPRVKGCGTRRAPSTPATPRRSCAICCGRCPNGRANRACAAARSPTPRSSSPSASTRRAGWSRRTSAASASAWSRWCARRDTRGRSGSPTSSSCWWKGRASPCKASAPRAPAPACMPWSASCSTRRPREKRLGRSTSHDLLPLFVQGRTKSTSRAIFLWLAQVARGLDDARDQAVVDGFFRVQPEIALHVDEHLLDVLAGLPGDDARDALARAQDLLRLDGDVGRRSAGAAAGLVNHEARVRQADAALFRRGEEDVRAGARYPAGADGGDLRAHEADHVVDRVARFDVAAGRGDQHGNRRVGLLGERDQARAGAARHGGVSLSENKHEARLEGEPLGDHVWPFLGLGLFLVGVHRVSWKGQAWYNARAAAFRFSGLQFSLRRAAGRYIFFRR